MQLKMKYGLLLVFICLGTFLIEGPAVVFAMAYDSHTLVAPATTTIAPGGSIQVTATVQPGCKPIGSCPSFSGTLTWDDGDVGGSFQTGACTFLSSDNLSLGRCTTTYNAPGVTGLVVIIASYSGNGAYAPSSGGSSIEIASPSSGLTTFTTTSSTNSSQASSGPRIVEVAALVGAIGVAAVALAAGFALRRRKTHCLRIPEPF